MTDRPRQPRGPEDDRDRPVRRASEERSGDASATGGRATTAAGERPSQSPWGLLLAFGVALALLSGHWELVVAILGLALLIFVHELGHFIFAKIFGMRVERFYIGFPPAIVSRTRGETEYGVGVIPLGGFCRISGMTPDEELPDEVVPRAYYSKPIWQRNITIAAGPAMNILAAVVLTFVFLMTSGIQQPTLRIGMVQAKTPAAAIGLHTGDRLVSGDGVVFRTWDQATAFFQAHPREAVSLVYRTPSGATRTVQVTLTTRPGAASEGFLGVGPQATAVRPNPLRATLLAVTGTADSVKLTFQGFWQLVSGRINPVGAQGAAGPVGIIAISQTAVRQNWYLLLLAFISVNLGIINLLPVLPFDGGHIFFNVLERIRGRRVDPRVLERVIAVGVVVLITLFVVLTASDIHRIIG